MKRNDPLNVSDSLNVPVSSDDADMEGGRLISDRGSKASLRGWTKGIPRGSWGWLSAGGFRRCNSRLAGGDGVGEGR